MTRPHLTSVARSWTVRLWTVATLASGSWAAAQNAPAPRPADAQQNVVAHAPSAAEQNFERLLFYGGPARVAGLRWLTDDARKRVDRLAQAHNLSDAQKKKVLLAAQGDLKRFTDEVDEAKRRLHTHANDTSEGTREAMKLRPALNILIAGQGPLLTKVFKATLRPEQRAAYETAQREQLAVRHKNIIGVASVVLARHFGLTDEQRSKLARILTDEIRPPRDYGSRPITTLFCLAAKVPEEKLRPLFGELQWNLFRGSLAPYQRNEGSLTFFGFIPAEDMPPKDGPRRPDPAK